MATSYTRQSSFSDGDTITAALFNDEFNQLLTAFSYASSSTTGHRHDGTAAEGGNVHTIGDQDFLNKIVADDSNNRWGVFVEVSSAAVEQVRFQDGVIVPVTDNDIDLGTSSVEFKDAYFDGTVTTDALTVDVNATIGGTLGVTGALTGSSTVQGTTITATTAFVPDASDGAALGTSALEFSDLFLADGAVINFGDDQDVSLTHVADTGLLLSSTDQLQFGDSGTYIFQSADGILDLVADTEIEINATTIDINGAVAMDGAMTGGTDITISGELDAATLDISGDADIDGTLEADAYTVDGTALNEYIADTVGAMVGSNTETNITVTYEDSDNTLDFVIGTLNQDTSGTAAIATTVTITDNESTNETNAIIFTAGGDLDGGNLGLESDGDLTYNPSTGLLSSTGVTASGTVTFGTLSDGTIGVTAWVDEDDMSTDSATLVPTQQSVKAYVDSQTSGSGSMSSFILEDDDGTEVSISDAEEVKFIGSGITTNWTDTTPGSDADPFDMTFTVDAAQTGITSIYATDLIMGEDSETAIDFGTPNEIDFKADNAARLTLTSSALYPVTDNEIDLGTASLEFKDAFFDGTVTADAFAGPLTGNVTGNASGTALTVTQAAQSAITSLGTLTTLTVDNVIINGTTIGHTDDTDLMTVADGIVTVAGEVSLTTLDIGGTNVTATAAELNYSDGVTSAIQTQMDTKASTGKAIAMAMVFG
jgi:cytoskeletal protein CcmA (bactofilin family)